MRHALATISLLLCPVWSAAPAAAQTFVNGSAQIPGGSPFNSSYTENVDFADVDLDGDFDAAFADGGDLGNDQNRLWINLGSAQGGTPGFYADETAARLPAITDASRDVEFADFDGDGDVDLDVTNHSSLVAQPCRFWINAGGLQGGSAGFFVDETASRWLGLGGPGSSLPPSQVLGSGGFFDYSGDSDYGDLDGDGDLDLVHSSYGGAFGGQVPTRIFLNDGAGAFTEFNPSGFQLPSVNIVNGQPALWAEGLQQANTSNATGLSADIAASALDVDLGDIDGDLDLDLLHGARQEAPRLFTNRLNETGAPTFRDVTGSHFLGSYFGGNGHYEQEMGDFDNDDDLDIYGLNWFNNFSDETLLNQGDGHFGAMTMLPSSQAVDNEADFGDYDNDGDLDVYVANFSGQDKLYRNGLIPSGVHSFVLATAELPSVTGTALDADWTDIDGDGDYDVMIAHDKNQANVLLRNQSQVADTWPPRAVHLEQAPDRISSAVPTRVRVQVYDNAPYYYTWYANVVLDFRVDGGIWYTLPMRSSGGQVFQGGVPGAMIGLIEYRVRATDRSGNTATSVVKSFVASDGGCNGNASFYCTAKTTSIPGCAPSFALNGVPSASAVNGFTVQVNDVPGGNPGLFLYTTNGAATTPIQNAYGFLCIQSGPGMFRIGFQTGSGTSGVCNGTYGMNFNQYLAAQTQDPNLGAGSDVDVQCWYRDPPNPGTANFTQALRFTVCP
jgi:hypothetical protein